MSVRVLVRLLHDGSGRASAAASAIMSRRRAEVVAATRPSSQATSTRFPRLAPSFTLLHDGDRAA